MHWAAVKGTDAHRRCGIGVSADIVNLTGADEVRLCIPHEVTFIPGRGSHRKLYVKSSDLRVSDENDERANGDILLWPSD